MALTPGTSVGGYEIVAPLGEGGMGEVYLARDTELRRQVALKVLPAAYAVDPERIVRFQREAETLAALSHPHIAAIHGMARTGAGIALVMEYVDGESPKGPLPFDEAWRIAAQMAEALEYAHERGVVHRDLKPANVKVTPDGTVKLLDVGLARVLHDPAAPALSDPDHSPTITVGGATMAGTILGTAAYMAPEQARGRRVDQRADIWGRAAGRWRTRPSRATDSRQSGFAASMPSIRASCRAPRTRRASSGRPTAG